MGDVVITDLRQEGDRWLVLCSEPSAENRRASIAMLKERGCTHFEHQEQYDINTDSTLLRTIGR